MSPTDALSLYFDEHSALELRERNLPHWRRDGKRYFITWRLADSIPAEEREQLRQEREAFIAAHGDPAKKQLNAALVRRYHQLFSERVQRWLDAGHGACVLRRPDAREIMRSALHHFEGTRYHLGSFAIAPSPQPCLVLHHTNA